MGTTHFHTLVEAFLAAPGDRPFVTMWRDEDNVESVTFGEFARLARLQAMNFHTQGLRSGDKIVLVMPQDIPLMAAFAGAMLLGAVPAILAYPNFKADAAKYSSGLAGVSKNLEARLVVVDDAFPAELVGQLAIADDAQLVRSSRTLVSATEPLLPSPPLEPGRIAFIQHSAGTTGLQKGVALSHGTVLTQLEHLTRALDITHEDRIYSWLPLYHDMGLIACFVLPLAYHLPVVMQSPIDWVVRPGTMLKLVSQYRCTLSWVPNFALQFMARRVRPEDRAQYDLSPLRALINCSEPVRAQSMDEFRAAYEPSGLGPNVLKSSYALAENVFAVTQSDIEAEPRRLWVDEADLSTKHTAVPTAVKTSRSVCLVSSGRCLPGNRMRVTSPDGVELPDGHVGEILLAGDSLFDGYYNRPDLTAEALQNGWYRSGDLGFSLDGEVYVIGRKKDLIIVAGKNIYPQDIEEIVCSHPAIHDGRAVAFGLYNPDLGTQDIIIVAETESVEDLKAAREIELAVRDAIAAEMNVTPSAIYLKPPKWIVKSTAGKPARSNTREKLLLEQPELIGKEYEYLFERLSDSVMTRTLEGEISFWSRGAEELYGWTKEEAIGKVSHALLHTQFPKPLEQIDSELVRRGRWEGRLVHAARDGRRVEVKSRWVLNLKGQPGAVVEINSPSAQF